jgi:hypothetical protein
MKDKIEEAFEGLQNKNGRKPLTWLHQSQSARRQEEQGRRSQQLRNTGRNPQETLECGGSMQELQ